MRACRLNQSQVAFCALRVPFLSVRLSIEYKIVSFLTRSSQRRSTRIQIHIRSYGLYSILDIFSFWGSFFIYTHVENDRPRTFLLTTLTLNAATICTSNQLKHATLVEPPRMHVCRPKYVHTRRLRLSTIRPISNLTACPHGMGY